jgi:hypothetical protein
MRIEIRYQTPYNACEWRSQWFKTLDEAQRMVDFYNSCGSPAHVAPSSLAQFETYERSEWYNDHNNVMSHHHY